MWRLTGKGIELKTTEHEKLLENEARFKHVTFYRLFWDERNLQGKKKKNIRRFSYAINSSLTRMKPGEATR